MISDTSSFTVWPTSLPHPFPRSRSSAAINLDSSRLPETLSYILPDIETPESKLASEELYGYDVHAEFRATRAANATGGAEDGNISQGRRW
jgi:hypothetical protein